MGHTHNEALAEKVLRLWSFPPDPSLLFFPSLLFIFLLSFHFLFSFSFFFINFP